MKLFINILDIIILFLAIWLMIMFLWVGGAKLTILENIFIVISTIICFFLLIDSIRET